MHARSDQVRRGEPRLLRPDPRAAGAREFDRRLPAQLPVPVRQRAEVQALLLASGGTLKRVSVEAFKKMLRGRAAPKERRSMGMPPEERFVLELKHAGIGGWVREHRFDPPRRWRFDFAWTGELVALEVHGGVWSHGRHTRGGGFTRDREKMNRARELGWWVIEATTEHVRDGRAMEWVREALEKRRSEPDALP